MTSASCAVMNASGTAAASDKFEILRDSSHRPLVRTTYSACPPPPTIPKTQSPNLIGADRVPSGKIDLSGIFEPRMSRRAIRRGRIRPLALQQVRTV